MADPRPRKAVNISHAPGGVLKPAATPNRPQPGDEGSPDCGSLSRMIIDLYRSGESIPATLILPSLLGFRCWMFICPDTAHRSSPFSFLPKLCLNRNHQQNITFLWSL
jgi:hypothetical protein